MREGRLYDHGGCTPCAPAHPHGWAGALFVVLASHLGETMGGMTQEALAWDAHRDHWQQLVNEVPIPPRRAQVPAGVPLPVVARLEWERDGVEHLDTVAWAWTTRAVLVELHDRRRQTIGAWLPAADVSRRA